LSVDLGAAQRARIVTFFGQQCIEKLAPFSRNPLNRTFYGDHRLPLLDVPPAQLRISEVAL
jgi:hypothetical protein